jgi:hypothetical protein
MPNYAGTKNTDKGGHDDEWIDYTKNRPYFGDPETLKSAGATTDDISVVDREDSVSGRAPDLDMTKDFVKGHDGWPKKVRP